MLWSRLIMTRSQNLPSSFMGSTESGLLLWYNAPRCSRRPARVKSCGLTLRISQPHFFREQPLHPFRLSGVEKLISQAKACGYQRRVRGSGIECLCRLCRLPRHHLIIKPKGDQHVEEHIERDLCRSTASSFFGSKIFKSLYPQITQMAAEKAFLILDSRPFCFIRRD